MRSFQNTLRKLNAPPGKALADPCLAWSILFGILTDHSSGFVIWHWESDRYLAPLDGPGEVKNALIKVLPLAPGSPQMPSDIVYNVIDF